MQYKSSSLSLLIKKIRQNTSKRWLNVFHSQFRHLENLATKESMPPEQLDKISSNLRSKEGQRLLRAGIPLNHVECHQKAFEGENTSTDLVETWASCDRENFTTHKKSSTWKGCTIFFSKDNDKSQPQPQKKRWGYIIESDDEDWTLKYVKLFLLLRTVRVSLNERCFSFVTHDWVFDTWRVFLF